MKKFVITIEETVSQDFEVEADNQEQAMMIAENKYRNCEFTLEPGNIIFRQMAVIMPNVKTTEWFEF